MFKRAQTEYTYNTSFYKSGEMADLIQMSTLSSKYIKLTNTFLLHNELMKMIAIV